ncbi:hypothetical protein ANCDUO_04027 [Ancylostoma duodenale]|uniref:Receptor L domain protein n=1 Tax=Ancylostoma duodenale TaxID=51022 RepID=A0A0C2GVX6_9BILA|nr:hypothetical protein ANCDUO_04027 [Ancylostoma duodenale]
MPTTIILPRDNNWIGNKHQGEVRNRSSEESNAVQHKSCAADKLENNVGCKENDEGSLKRAAFVGKPAQGETIAPPKMQGINRLVTCLIVLLYNRAAALSDDGKDRHFPHNFLVLLIAYDLECANYHELRSLSDYGTFVEDCAGKKVLGFESGVSNKFFASKLTEDEFNGLFANAVKVSFFIYIENTKFVELKMPKVRELVGGLSIRNNRLLKTFHINRAHKFVRTANGPTTVTVDGNPVLSQESYAELRHLCDYCDVFEYTKCSALDPVQPAFYSQLVSKCAGERIIKQKPGARFYLKANKMSQEQFNALFSQATHVELCINFQDMQWKEITFPKLVRLIPCGYGDPSLNIVHNLYLTAINLPVYHSEGFGRLNSMTNVVLKNNFILRPQSFNR